MHIRVVEKPGAPWTGLVHVDDGAVWLDSEPYYPLDDLTGLVVEDAEDKEVAALTEVGFLLLWLQ